MSYIGQTPGIGVANRYIYTASGSETTVTTSDGGVSISYTVGQVDVYLNGIKMVVGTDVTATTGSSIVFASALSASDVVEIYALDSFSVADTLAPSAIGVTVQAYDATLLNDADIGSTVQAYDADTAKLDVAQTFTAEQTFQNVIETVYNTGTALDAANGGIQYKTLSANTTFTDSLSDGESMTLRLEGGATYTVTYPTMTWVGSGGNVAPTLNGTKDTIVFWKESSTLYGAYVGYGA